MIRVFSLFLIGAKKINKGKKYPARVPGEFSFILRLCDHHSDHNDDDMMRTVLPEPRNVGYLLRVSSAVGERDPRHIRQNQRKDRTAAVDRGKWANGQYEGTQNINGIARGELTDNQQAPPLLASSRARLFYCLANLFLGLFDVGLDLFAALVNNFDHGFLFLHHLLHLVEQVGKFDNGLFDALDFVVSGLDLAESGSGFTTTITAEEL